MMKKTLVIVFSFLFLTLTFEKGVIIMSHYLRQDYISRNLCVNPETACHGSCHLKKELKSSEERSQNPSIPDVSWLTEKVFLKTVNFSFTGFIFPVFIATRISSPAKLPGITGEIFHPPQG